MEAVRPVLLRVCRVVLVATLPATAWLNAPEARAQAPAAERAPDTLEERVRACIGCHGVQGRGVENVYFPRLAGKPAGYLYNQLVAFRDGRRKYVPMNYLLAYLPDPYLMQMAQHFARLDPPPLAQPAVDRPAQQLVDGRRIVTQGIPARKIPACASCHGAGLGGREPGIPGLLGLRADYVSAQLGAWRYGLRTALAPDCMQVIAASLTEPEVAAVSAWLASLPVDPGVRPAKTGGALPMGCGSQAR
ncbi:cytochrome c553 [Pseudoduganella lurida]|uniref:Cytochrome c553 n=1 Tax=Pseudoduganella lurida TaxID=1036180 RepID=A0A562R698_9BURK|nr:cytochrome c553 [Pseudoduganella lurida]